MVGPSVSGRGEPQRALAASLWLYPAELGEDPDFSHEPMPLRLELEEPRLNFAALTAETGDEGATNEVAEALFEILPAGAFDAESASRLVVSGDSRQLRHVSFLAAHRQRSLAQRNGLDHDEVEHLDYRSKSLLDPVSDRVSAQH